ncbi:MAG: hypothetical protein QOE61_3278, partial [Micromonosporaceae bacterium]|nr:hypothetical protein [Micromonosporaceae bacterium]
LKQQGHDVRWYAGPSYQHKLNELGITCLPYQRAREVTAGNLDLIFPERAKLKGPKRLSFDLEQLFVANVEHYHRDIVDIRTEFPFHAFFCDAAFYAGKLVAATSHVPAYTVGVSPLLANSRHVPPPFFGLQPARTVFGKLMHRGIRTLVLSSVRTGARRYNAVLATEGIAPVAVRDWFDLSHSFATRYFQNGVPGLDYPRGDLPANITFVGALPAHRTGRNAEFAHWERVRTHPKGVVAVSQGTVDNHDPEKLIVPTLEALKDGPHLVVATTGGQNTQQLRRRYPQDNIIIEDHVDFDVLFAHTDVLVCNGGYGSVMSALSHGVPVLAAGLREGKNDINARLAYRHLGIDLKTERPTPAQLSRGVADLLANDTVRQNVARIRAELQSYQPFDIIDRQLAADLAGDPAVGAASQARSK